MIIGRLVFYKVATGKYCNQYAIASQPQYDLTQVICELFFPSIRSIQFLTFLSSPCDHPQPPTDAFHCDSGRLPSLPFPTPPLFSSLWFPTLYFLFSHWFPLFSSLCCQCYLCCYFAIGVRTSSFKLLLEQ